jgi:PAS domain S-box-containing protein
VNDTRRLTDAFKNLINHEALRLGDPVAANRLVLKWSADAIGVPAATLRFFSSDRLRLRCMEHYSNPHKWIQGGPELKTGEMPRFFLAIESGSVLAVSDAENDRRTEEFYDRVLQARGVVSLLAAPIRILGDLVGILCFKQTGEKRQWTPEEAAFAGEVGNLAAQVIVNSKRIRTEEKLRRYRGRLESLVESRTQQLERVNANLKRENELRKRSESALRESEEGYRKLFEGAPFGIFHTAFEVEKGGEIDVNPAMGRMLGYASAGELLAERGAEGVIEAVLAEPGEKRQKLMAEILKTRGWLVYEQHYRRRDGSVMVGRQRLRAVRDPEGRPVLLEGFVEDITQKRLAEQEAKQLQAQLLNAQKREAVGILAGGIAHDFNNLLSPIMGFSELALQELPRDSRLRSHVEKILTAGDRAKELARQILAFSHQGKPEQRPVLVQSIVQEALGLLRRTVPSTIRFDVRMDEYCGPVMADPTQIQQVLMNLGTNAYHAMKEGGGTLSVRLRPVALGEADLKGFPKACPGSYAELTVADTGSGIEPRLIDKVFDPYFTTKGVGEGTGLGLSMVHGIVKGHGGTIAVESRVGEGTTFRICLPRLDSEAVPTEESIEETVCMGRRQNVLLVDDERQVLETLEEMLDFCNYRVTVTGNGMEALETFQADPDAFDAVVTDLTMPGMTGVQLARAIQAIRPATPVVLCTGYKEAMAETEHLGGIRKVLLKPVGMKALSGALDELLPGERGEEEHQARSSSSKAS